MAGSREHQTDAPEDNDAEQNPFDGISLRENDGWVGTTYEAQIEDSRGVRVTFANCQFKFRSEAEEGLRNVNQ